MLYLVLALKNEVFLFATALGIDILKTVQQFIRIYSVSIFIYAWRALCARRLYFQVKKTFHFFKNDTSFINKLRGDLSVIDLIAGAKVIEFVGWAAQV